VGSVTAEALFRSLERGGRGGTWLLLGDEEYLKEEAVQALIAAHLEPATRDFNLDQLRAQGLDPETLASICQTPPLLSDWRVVVVRDAQHLAANARLRSVIEQLTGRPVPGLALILETSTGEKSASKFQEKLERDASTIRFMALAAADVPGWLMERAVEAGIEIDPAAARAMAAISGAGLGVLKQELAKLIDFVGDRRRIGTDDVARLVGGLPRQDRWAWFDLVGEARFTEARAGLPILLDAGESGVGLLIALGTHMLRIGLALTGDDQALGSVLGRNQAWLASRFKRQAGKWSCAAVDTAIADLLRADRLLKTAPLDAHHVLDELLFRMQQAQSAA
jgi:DNA polymerase-3 subunit delta